VGLIAMSVTRIICFAALGLIVGAVVVPSIFAVWHPSTVTTSHSVGPDGIPVHSTIVDVQGPVAAAQGIGPIAGAIAGIALAMAWDVRRQRRRG
jgi:hypothetical protein